nr:hypothetical protein BgiMline_016384 [Biomphalaria glabrata]
MSTINNIITTTSTPSSRQTSPLLSSSIITLLPHSTLSFHLHSRHQHRRQTTTFSHLNTVISILQHPNVDIIIIITSAINCSNCIVTRQPLDNELHHHITTTTTITIIIMIFTN